MWKLLLQILENTNIILELITEAINDIKQLIEGIKNNEN